MDTIVPHEHHPYVTLGVCFLYRKNLPSFHIVKHTLGLKDYGLAIFTIDTIKVAPAIELDTPIRSIIKSQRITERFVFILTRKIGALPKKRLNLYFKLRTVGRRSLPQCSPYLPAQRTLRWLRQFLPGHQASLPL